VALTRARDRLYLSTPLVDGRVVAGRGSLAEVLPASLIQRIESGGAAHADPPDPAPLLHPTPDAPASGSIEQDPPYERDVPPLRDYSGSMEQDPPCEHDVLPLRDAAVARVPAGVALSSDGGGRTHAGGGSSRLIGVLVHRLLQRVARHRPSAGGPPDEPSLRARIEAALRPDDDVDGQEREQLADRVSAAFRALWENDEVRALYAAGTALPEVPFTMRDGNRIVRGTVDCLILRSAPGIEELTILEFKTGHPSPEHEVQAALYTRAVRAAYPSAIVNSRLFYAGWNQAGETAV
jgi:hypothetical protein